MIGTSRWLIIEFMVGIVWILTQAGHFEAVEWLVRQGFCSRVHDLYIERSFTLEPKEWAERSRQLEALQLSIRCLINGTSK